MKLIRLGYSMAIKVISYCLYYNGDVAYISTNDMFNRYLLGLTENIKYRDRYFPGWEIHLYLEDWLVSDIAVQSAIMGVKDLKVVPFNIDRYDKLHYAAFERFRVLWDKAIDVAIIRDVDQLLTAEDARLVDEWCSQRQKFLIYRWEHMTLTAMGGGFAFKRSKAGEPIDSTSYDEFVGKISATGVYDEGRGFDEQCITSLSEILRFGPVYGGRRSREVITTFSRPGYWRSRLNGRMLIRPNNYMLGKPITIRRSAELSPYEGKLHNPYDQYLWDIAMYRYKRRMSLSASKVM